MLLRRSPSARLLVPAFAALLLCAALLALDLWVHADAAEQTRQTLASGGDAAQLALSSGLPVLSIETETGTIPDAEETLLGQITLYSVAHGQLRQQTARTEISERGNTSRRFPKKSYRLKLVDSFGNKVDMPLAGLRSDDDWLLNPLYTDTSKIREALAYELWALMNSSGTAAASSRMVYAEVFLNGEYWGLYGVQERIDRKQVDGSKQADILYKVVANDRPTSEELLQCRSEEGCRGFQLEFSGAAVTDAWKPAAAYMALIDGEPSDGSCTVSLENAIDYGLWAMVTQAHDCHFKNQFVHCVYQHDGYRMYKIPWDLNNTFGDVWINDAPEENHTGYRISSLVKDSVFRVLLDSENPAVYEAIVRRWTALRRSVLTEEGLIARAHALYDPLIDAMDRDSLRWPSCGMGNGNARNIRDVEDFIRVILPRIDAFVQELTAPEGSEAAQRDISTSNS